MVLDLDLFRPDKGGNPDKIRENQRLRFKDVDLVNTVIEQDGLWRQLRHKADNWNKLKNVCSKEIGEKMKKKEDQGNPDDEVPDNVQCNLDGLTKDMLQSLTINQIKKVRTLIDTAMENNEKELAECEKRRNTALREVGNHLHESVPVSDNEDENKIERMHGDCTVRKSKN